MDYGGVFDLYYKLGALQQQDVKIHLHCFEYGRGEQPMLNQFCESVSYYRRNTGFSGVSVDYPYIVSSRKNEELLNRLLQDDYPILIEGVHCTYLLNDPRFAGRKCFVRLHNVEHIYYKHLFENAGSPLKKLYFLYESNLLKGYETKIANRATFWSVTEKDAETYRALGCDNIQFLPLFLPNWKVNTTEGKGNFCLYQGDLSVGENEKAAIWLIEEVFDGVEIPFVVAGKNPSRKLQALVHSRNNCCLIANPEEREMQELIEKAHINIIPSYNSTGIKLKLINALYNGRHCVVNDQTVEGSGLYEACHIASGAEGFKEVIKHLQDCTFTTDDIAIRHQLLDNMFNNERNAKQMVEWIWGQGRKLSFESVTTSQ